MSNLFSNTKGSDALTNISAEYPDNFTNHTGESSKINPNEVLVWSVVTFFICAFGSLTNSLVLYATWPGLNQKAGVNLLVFNFITMNFVSCAVHCPTRVVMVLTKHLLRHPAPLSVCHVIQTLNNATWSALYYSELELGINRRVALYFPHQYKAHYTPAKNAVRVGFVWLFALAGVLPFNFGIGNRFIILPIGHCATRTDASPFGMLYVAHIIVAFLLGCVTSLAVLWKCYAMRRTAGKLTGTPHGAREAHLEKRITMAVALVGTYLWGAVGNILSTILIYFSSVYQRDPLANVWMQTFIIAQYSINPCIILLSNENYRRRLRSLLYMTSSCASNSRKVHSQKAN